MENQYIRNNEEKILTLLTRDANVRLRALEFVEKGFFGDTAVVGKMFELQEKIEQPNQFNLIAAVNEHVVEAQQKAALHALIGRMFSTPLPDFKEAFTTTKAWMEKAHWSVIGPYDFDAEKFSTHQRIMALAGGGTRDEIISTKTRMIDMRNSWLESETKDRFPFQDSFPTLNRVTRGGMMRGETGLILQRSGQGKTTSLNNLMAQYVLKGFGGLYIQLEGKADKIYRRMAANLMNIPSQNMHLISDAECAASDELLHSLQFIVRRMPIGTTPDQLLPVLRQYQQEFGTWPDLVFIDYIAKMSPNRSKSSKNDGSFQTIGKINADLLNIAIDHECVIWSAAQANREAIKVSKGGNKIGAEHLSESITYLYDSTLLLVQDLFHTDGSTGYFNAHVEKYRENNDWPEYHLTVDYPTAQFQEVADEEWMPIISAKILASGEAVPTDEAPHQPGGSAQKKFSGKKPKKDSGTGVLPEL